MTLRIAIVVPGRFDAFDLARELLAQGQEVVLLTNYPKSVVARYGVPPECVRSALWHGLLIRADAKAGRWSRSVLSEAFLHRTFSRWALHEIKQMKGLDLVYCFSGVAEELFRGLPDRRPWKSLVRESSHIRLQSELLEGEGQRAERFAGRAVHIDRPSPWMVEREEREYLLADRIFVLSSFAAEGFSRELPLSKKLTVLGQGSRTSVFRPSQDVIRERQSRILRGEPLRVLTVGTFSLRKGAIDLVEVARGLRGVCRFEFVGSIGEDARWLHDANRDLIVFRGRIPQQDLPEVYAAADLFLFPTIEDGYAVVLAQAQAAGLPIIASCNCAAPDLVEDGRTGWVLPIRQPGLYVERLRWCDMHRDALAGLLVDGYQRYRPRDWAEVADRFLRCHEALLNARAHPRAVVS